jgi:Fe-S-cluster containining protein
MKKFFPDADLARVETWTQYRKGLCDSCRATCCTMPAEVRVSDLVRMGLVDEFEVEEPLRTIARRLEKEGVVDHFNGKSERFTLARLANDDCVFLDGKSRRCTIYEQRPETCRNHPQIGPRPGWCPYQAKRDP